MLDIDIEVHIEELFLLQIGWPSSLPTNEKDAFVRNILKAKVRIFSEDRRILSTQGIAT